MSKMGRPKSENKKEILVATRLTEEEFAELEECCKILGKTKAEVIRTGIKNVHKDIKK